MSPPPRQISPVLARLDALRAEFIDLAVALERRGRADAADVALATSSRLAEVRDELALEEVRTAPEIAGASGAA